MSERRIGILLLVVALLAALVTARLSGQRVAGVGVPRPGLGVPQTGDCLSEISASPQRGPASPYGISSVGASAVTYGACTEPHVGEVVAFRVLSEPVPVDTDSDGEWCQGVATGYRALTASVITRGIETSWWTPVVGHRFMVVLSVPGLLGFRWANCAVVSPRGERYEGRYTDSFGLSRTPAPFGQCLLTRTDTLVSCTEPHDGQNFAIWSRQVATDGGLVMAACVEIVARTTGMPDVTAGGRLRVQVVDTAGAPVGGDTPVEGRPAVRCRVAVVGDAALVGSLVGVGAGPVPWS